MKKSDSCEMKEMCFLQTKVVMCEILGNEIFFAL